MRTIYFATSNLAKVEEAQKALNSFGIKIKHLKMTKPEEQDETLEQIAKHGAEFLAKKTGKELVVEDAGLFFEAYPGFPGTSSKHLYKQLGFEGMLKLLKGKKRAAYFKTAIGYAKPGKPAKIFIGISRGSISKFPMGRYNKNIPYDRIFIPRGYKKTYSLLPSVKDKTSHRTAAFKKLGRFLSL